MVMVLNTIKLSVLPDAKLLTEKDLNIKLINEITKDELLELPLLAVEESPEFNDDWSP